MLRPTLLPLITSLALCLNSFGQDTESAAAPKAGKSAAEIAKELANPNTPLASLTLKYQYRTFAGDIPGADSRSSNSLLFQPSLPFQLENGDKVIWRPAVPVFFDQPVLDPATGNWGSEGGLGDIAFDLAYARTTKDGILMATGIITTLPTATSNKLGSGQWSLGPELLIGKISKTYVLGAFPNHQWNVAGWSDREVNLTTSQIFATYLPGGGWNIGSTPIISYDWTTDELSLPINLTVGKTVIWNGKPWKLAAEINYYIDAPDSFGPEWFFGINVTPVIANPLAKFFQ
ncbi:hypothetical protein [Coraliomargarita akajimensis]|uniref:Neuromedin U n=1 Tax=Coraliomargarita akajimensis (strain DSM 45221 / IAM 15411 / JCM 23193 / KCTC 12865 / 04OKA010-24) TaxID=583355 RepID=D5EPC4_CORAD|nr:hypothetical protein [Coraliomargarita akajimensis]ADE55634.1 conserved hypothetical protein [Coraliomargarita akajimensis DSM 45221]